MRNDEEIPTREGSKRIDNTKMLQLLTKAGLCLKFPTYLR
jgi:hypothetical protein